MDVSQDQFDHDKGQKSAISGRRLHWRLSTGFFALSPGFMRNLVRRAPENLEIVAKNPVEKIASNPVTSVAVMVFSALSFGFFFFFPVLGRGKGGGVRGGGQGGWFKKKTEGGGGVFRGGGAGGGRVPGGEEGGLNIFSGPKCPPSLCCSSSRRPEDEASKPLIACISCNHSAARNYTWESRNFVCNRWVWPLSRKFWGIQFMVIYKIYVMRSWSLHKNNSQGIIYAIMSAGVANRSRFKLFRNISYNRLHFLELG